MGRRRPGDQVHIRVDAVDGHARIQIADTGPGIGPAELPHVFDRLWRGTGSRSITGDGHR